MIFVAGHSFVFQPKRQTTSNVTAISIQERMAGRAARHADTDSRFIPGHTYRVGLIRKIEDDNKKIKVRYLFVDMSEIHEDIDVVLDDTGAGDEYIATLSGSMSNLLNERAAIAKAAESNDF